MHIYTPVTHITTITKEEGMNLTGSQGKWVWGKLEGKSVGRNYMNTILYYILKNNKINDKTNKMKSVIRLLSG